MYRINCKAFYTEKGQIFSGDVDNGIPREIFEAFKNEEKMKDRVSRKMIRIVEEYNDYKHTDKLDDEIKDMPKEILYCENLDDMLEKYKDDESVVERIKALKELIE